MAAVATEQTPLLGASVKPESDKPDPRRYILVQVIGAGHLSNDPLLEPYCVAQFGTKTIHKTKPAKGTVPIWTLDTNSLFVIPVTPTDVANNKQLTLTIWAAKQRALSDAARKAVTGTKVVDFYGKIKLGIPTILSHCDEERTELPLCDEMGNEIVDSTHPVPTVALRFRVATQADLNFVHAWNKNHKLDTIDIERDGPD